MRLFLLVLGVSVLGVAALTACNSAEFKNARTSAKQNAPLPADGARRVTVPELKGMLDRNEAFVIDVRNDTAFNSGHIHGAKLIPEAEIVNHLDELPRNKVIVTYCS